MSGLAAVSRVRAGEEQNDRLALFSVGLVEPAVVVVGVLTMLPHQSATRSHFTSYTVQDKHVVAPYVVTPLCSHGALHDTQPSVNK